MRTSYVRFERARLDRLRKNSRICAPLICTYSRVPLLPALPYTRVRPTPACPTHVCPTPCPYSRVPCSRVPYSVPYSRVPLLPALPYTRVPYSPVHHN